MTTRLDHNSVLRPLHHLAETGVITWDAAPFDERGFVTPDAVEALLRPTTRAVVMTHASNVLGTVQPVAEIARRCAARGVPVIVDAAQSAGQVPIDMTAMGVAALAFTGHKSLYGPSGIGGLVVMPDLDLATSRFGGTGMDSASLVHTQSYPLRLEAGTLNLLGRDRPGAGHRAGRGPAARTASTSGRWRCSPACAMACARSGASRSTAPTTSRTTCRSSCATSRASIRRTSAPSSTATSASPSASASTARRSLHRDLGTIDRGAVRFSLGAFTTEADVDAAIEAMGVIAGIRR